MRVTRDISHGIEPFDVAQGVHVLKAVYQDFPPGTVHIFAVQGSRPVAQHIAFQWADHYFVGSDNGFVGLLVGEAVTQCVALETKNELPAMFPAQALYAPAAVQLSQGVPLEAVGAPSPNPQRLVARQLRIIGNQLLGYVIHVDHYGNLVTNITQEAFEQQHKGTRFEIRFARETLYTLHTHYTQVEPGDCLGVFNSLGFLEIAINQGHAAELLGMQYDSGVCITFHA
ncbi:MAG: SAM-dependent chlorinase/fluorinase [Bacteroidota bacterium]